MLFRSIYLKSGATHANIFQGSKQDTWQKSQLNSDDEKKLYEDKDLRLAATWWTHHIDIDWERLNPYSHARRISLPTYPFERRRCWVDQQNFSQPDQPLETHQLLETKEMETLETGELVANFYNKMAPYMKELLGTEDPHLIFAPLEKKIEGFSWVLIYNEPEKHPEHAAIIASKQKEAKQILYRGIDFAKVNKVMDIGCGFGTDLIDLSLTYPHITGDGFTIASNQAKEGSNRIRNKGLDDRLRIFCKDSSKNPFPALYDLVIGFEVFPHIEHKQRTFENIYQHLNQDGRILLADCVANTVTEINMPELAMFTSTSPQYSEILSQVGLKLIECVDISVEIANFLDDSQFESNFAYLCSVNPIIKQFESEYRSWYNFGQGIKKKVLRYLLLTIAKAEPHETIEELRVINQRQFDYPVSYKEAVSQISSAPSTLTKTVSLSKEEVAREWLEQKLVEITSREMEMEPDKINVTARFADYGVGSLQGLLLVDAINREFDLRLKIQVIYDYSSLRDLSQFLIANYGQNLAKSRKTATSSRELLDKQTRSVPPQIESKITPQKNTTDIAVIGMSGRFPGANNLSEFWEILQQGVDSITEVPPKIGRAHV